MSESLVEPQNVIDFVVNKGNGVKGLSQTNLKSIPELYINPPEERLDQTQVVTKKSIPTIDVSKWDDPEIADSICKAAAQFGFFQIINHGIPIEVLENVKEAAHEFFELPVEERRKYLKENSPSPTVELMTSHSPLVDKVLEWKDYLIHYCDGQEIEDSKFWPHVSRSVMWIHVYLFNLNFLLIKVFSCSSINPFCASCNKHRVEVTLKIGWEATT